MRDSSILSFITVSVPTLTRTTYLLPEHSDIRTLFGSQLDTEAVLTKSAIMRFIHIGQLPSFS